MKSVLVLITIWTIFNILEVESRRLLIRTKRAYGGELAEEGEFPFMVSIRSYGYHSCGGSIITPYWILTAAHCTQYEDPEGITIEVGANALSTENASVYETEDIITHPDFSSSIQQLKHDVGLIKLKQPLTFSNTVQPIFLGKIRKDAVANVVAAGWGLTGDDEELEKLRFVEMRTMSTGPCQKIHSTRNNIVDGNTQICAISDKEQSLCSGDSGAALVDLVSGRQIGVFSGFETCTGEFPTLHARVESYIDWISKITNHTYLLE